MTFEIKITPEDVDALVRDTILKAGLGKVLQDAIATAIRPGGYNNPIDAAVSKYIGEVAGTLIRERFNDQVLAAVNAAIAEKVTPQLIEAVVKSSTDRLVRAAEESRY